MLSSSFAGLSLGNSRSKLLLPAPTSSLHRSTQLTIEAAHKKGGGSTKNGRDSNAQRRGVKVFGGQPVKAGGIIIRQTGSTVHAGDNVSTGKDYTLFALQAGIVVFKKNKYKKQVSVVNVEDYVVPEGNRRKEGSRRERKKAEFRAKRMGTTTVSAATVVAP